MWLIALALAGCGVPRIAEAGTRHLIIPVENLSNQPAEVIVAEDAGTLGQIVGRAEPHLVPPGVTTDVELTVPRGTDWAVFVNSRPDRGSLFGANDIPVSATGRLPILVTIARDGSPSVSGPGVPGWFGN